MKSVFTIALSFYFSLAVFMPHTDFHELTKLPTLVAHFFDCGADKSKSLVAFLDIHYGSEDQKTHHHQDEHDGKLPFQDHHTCHTSHIFITVSSSPLPYCEMELTESTFSNYQYIVSSEHLNSIFQPPKA